MVCFYFLNSTPGRYAICLLTVCQNEGYKNKQKYSSNFLTSCFVSCTFSKEDLWAGLGAFDGRFWPPNHIFEPSYEQPAIGGSRQSSQKTRGDSRNCRPGLRGCY